MDESSVAVSVIMPVYNAERYISEAVRSVLGQGFHSFELIVVDDCSVDGTFSLVQDIAKRDSRVRLIRMNVNSGPAAARNRALDLAVGRYVAFLDADDSWEPGKLEQQLALFEEGVAVVFSSYWQVDEFGRELSVRTVPEVVDYSKLLRRNYIGNLTGVYDRSLVPDLRFDSVGHEDYAFWLRVLRESNGVALGVATPLARYRVHAGSLSSNKLRAVLWTWRVYRHSERLPFLNSLLCMATQLGGAYMQRLKSMILRLKG